MPPVSFRTTVAVVSLLLATACAKQTQPPEAVPGAESTTVATGALVVLDGSGSVDPNSPPRQLIYRWAFRSLPPGSQAQINNPAVVNPSFRADVDGEYEVELVVSNGLLSSTPTALKVTAGPCGSGAPTVATVTATPAAPTTGQVVQMGAEFQDADLDPACNLSQRHSFEWTIVALPPDSQATLNTPAAVNPSFVADRPGDYTLQLVVTDSTGRRSEPFPFTVTVSGCGDAAPSVSALTATPAAPNINQLVSLSVTATDADNAPECGANQTLSYEWFFVSLPTGSRASLNNPAIDSPSFRPDLEGDYVVRVRVTDSTGRSALSDPLIITGAACGGAAPAVGGITASPASPNTGEVVQFTATVTDADASSPCSQPQTFTHAWQLISQPSGSTATLNNSAAENPSLVADAPGSYLVRLIVRDQSGRASPARDFTLTVSTCGSAAPVAVVQLAGTAFVGQPLQASATVTDADSSCAGLPPEQFSYQWSFAALPQGSQAQLNSATVSNPTFTVDVPGTYTLQLVVTDTAGHQSAPSFAQVQVGSCGTNAPEVSAQATPDQVATLQQVALSATVTDVDNDPACQTLPDGGTGLSAQSFTYAWSFESMPAGSQAQLNNAALQSPSFTPDVAGQYVVRLLVTDSTGRSGRSGPVTVSVSPCGSNAPTVTLSAPSPAATGQLVVLDAQGADADNDPSCQTLPDGGVGIAPQSFTYAWRFDSVPAGSQAQLNNAAVKSPSFTADVAGQYVVRVLVTDSTGRSVLSAPVTATVDACGGNTPVTTGSTPASPISALVGQNIQVTGLFDDVDNSSASCQTLLGGVRQTFTYQWRLVELPAGSQATLNAPVSLSPTLTPDVSGNYVLEFRVTDSTGRQSTPLNVTVAAAVCGGQAPDATPTATPSAGANLGSVVQLSAGAADPDNAPGCALGQVLTCSWSFLQLPAGSQARLSDPTVCNPSFIPDVAADASSPYVAVVRVTDPTGRSSSLKTVSVTTNGACGGHAPVAGAAATALLTPPVVVGPGANITLHVPLACAIVQLDGRPGTTDADNSLTCNLNQTLFFDWQLFAMPAGSQTALSNESAVNPWFIPDEAGAFVVRLSANDGALQSASPALVTVLSPGNEVGTTVDAAGGSFTSLAMHPVNGKPRIAYAAGIGNELRYARCDAFCGSSSAVWSLFTVATDVIVTDVDHVSLALGANDAPQIAFHTPAGSGATGDLRHAVCTANCESGTPVWTVTIVDPGLNTAVALDCGVFSVGTQTTSINNGRFTSIAFDGSGRPMISYNRQEVVTNTCTGSVQITEALRYAVFEAGSWRLVQVDRSAGELRGRFTSIAPDRSALGRPRISYYVPTGGELRYAVCTAACDSATATFDVIVVDGAGATDPDVGRHSSLVVGADNASRISYFDATNLDLKYAACTGSCDSAGATFALSVVDAPDDRGRFSSIEVDASDRPHIAYYDATAGNLRFASCVSNCAPAQTPVFSLRVLDEAGDVGQHASLALTPLGRPRVSYLDVSNNDLDYFIECGP